MNARPAFWGMVTPGHYIHDRNGKTWRVERLNGTHAILVDAKGVVATISRPPSTREVTILEPTMDEAVATVVDRLEARVVGETQPNRPMLCPAFTVARQSPAARDHLHIVHGMYVDDVKTPKGLVEAHQSSHEKPDPLFVMDHVHKELSA